MADLTPDQPPRPSVFARLVVLLGMLGVVALALALVVALWVNAPQEISVTASTTTTSTTLAHQYLSFGGRTILTACVYGDRIYDGYEWGQVIADDPSCPQDGVR